MSGYQGMPARDVRILRPDQLDEGLTGGAGLQRLAEITHLPTGIKSEQIDTVSVAAGCRAAECVAPGEAALLHVVAGHVRVQWGPALDAETAAGPGDTVLVPAGTRYRADNASPSAALQFIIVHGG
jgi:uncharacterized RmlC-like cupin family protein